MTTFDGTMGYSGLVIVASDIPLPLIFGTTEERIEEVGESILPSVSRELISGIQNVISGRIGRLTTKPCHRSANGSSRRPINSFRLVDLHRSDLRQSP